ncbi:hypothetical protein BCR43DRAFT_527581 [Syncephalastrum racemosum]|uniref:Cyclin N-terminal domain-containing protein n=1 Tax=Syncephalastrum racemosum TaxID=13706 RepID=A0A1X2H4M2_SYNRA|nr:hypothetical protein BCR43DRAFT_527581 [Syncephalastrum racemosum]
MHRFDLAAQVYDPSEYNYWHAALFLHVLKQRKREPLQRSSIEILARQLTRTWRPSSAEEDIPQFASFIENLLHATALSTNVEMDQTISLDQAIVLSVKDEFALPVVCPATTMACTLVILERLNEKMSYAGNHTSCAPLERLVTVAYLMAAKASYAGLRSVMAIGHPSPIPSGANTPRSMDDWIASSLPNVRRLLELLDLPPNDALSYCRMELELIHFVDYRLQCNPLEIWPLFFRILKSAEYPAANAAPASMINNTTCAREDTSSSAPSPNHCDH